MSLCLFKVKYVALGVFVSIYCISLNIYSNEAVSHDERSIIVTSKNAKQKDADVIIAATASLNNPDKKNMSKKSGDITSSIVVIPKTLDDGNHSIYPIITVERKNTEKNGIRKK